MDFFNKMADMFIKANRRLKKWRRVVSALAAIVVFVTTYAMVLPAITLDKDTASTQSGMEIAASDQESGSDGTVYESEPEEEPVEASAEDSQEESAADDSGSQEAEVSEEQSSDEKAEDYGQDTSSNEEESAAETGKTVELPAADGTSESAKTVEEVQLITEKTQLSYQYIDESFGKDPEDDVDDGYTVYAEFGADAKLPVGVELKVTEITKESDPEAYEAYYEKALSELQNKYDENTDLSFARFYDISFVYNGEEVEPSGYVRVRIEYNKPVEVKTDENVDTVHFDKNNDEKPEVIESEVETEKKGTDDTVKTVEFESGSFSVYGVIGSYTVDFEYEVDGRMYQFSLPGGGYVSFTDLVEVLGIIDDTNSEENGDEKNAVIETSEARDENGLLDITESDATKKFVADVVSVEFSSPELVDVSKVENETTVGQIKENRGLECEYSAELTNEQIAAINDTEVESGDWALISVHPFTSEETLTVTMNDGEVFTVRVTDGQIKKTVISASGDTYEITVTYGEDAQIPEGAELKVREITEEDSEFASLQEDAQNAVIAKYETQPEHFATFDIAIMDGDNEIEPAEGSFVAVEIRLKNELAEEMLTRSETEENDSEADPTDSGAEHNETADTAGEDTAYDRDGFPITDAGIMVNGVPVTSDEKSADPEENNQEENNPEENNQEENNQEENNQEENNSNAVFPVVHHVTSGEPEVVDGCESNVDDNGDIQIEFVTGSFSNYSIGGNISDNYGAYAEQKNNLTELPSTLYVGDSVYFLNKPNYVISNVSPSGAVDLSNRGDDNHKVLEIYEPCTFTIMDRYNNWDTKTITVKRRQPDTNFGTIETVNNDDIGVTLNLFDYDKDNQLNEIWNRTYDRNWNSVKNYYTSHGINNNHSLKFWAGGITYDDYNKYTEDNLGNYFLKDSLVNGYPELKGNATNGNLKYLFSDGEGLSQYAERYKANRLFTKDDDGYYVYNSGIQSDPDSGHYAYFDKGTGNFTVYDSTYCYNKGGHRYPVGFFPFTELSKAAVDSNGNAYLNSNQYLNHHFGMTMSVDFNIPHDKKDVNDNPITFEFSGDDDMWVFVDGKLVLDIGGIHQPISGKINFTDGTVTYKDKTGKTISGGGLPLSTTGNRGVTLNSEGTHTLQVFYMERGGCDSNCMIKFNTIPYKKIKFNKIDAHNNRIPGAVFKLFRDENCTQALMIPRSKTEGGTTTNYYEEAISTSTEDGYVIFDKIPVGTYYMKEVTVPDHYDSDGKVYTAVVTASQVSEDNYATIYWKDAQHPIGEGIVNYEKFPIEVTKKWVKAGTTEEAAWPKDTKISYKVIRHVYLEVTGSDDQEIPGTEEVVFAAEGDSLLTETHKSHVVPDLSKVGKWKSPLVVTPEMEALGIEANTEYLVKYKYTVVEDPEGSTYTGEGSLLPIEATTTETDVDIKVSDEEKEKGDKVILTNEITELEVLKTWKDGNDKHDNDSVTVQLYRVAKKSDTPVIPDTPSDDDKITILVDTSWVYENETSAKEKDIPGNGTIKAQITDGENTWTLDLTPDNNWTASKSDLPKKDKDGKNITYTVTYLQQETSFSGATNVKGVVVTQPSTVTGSNGKVTLKATVEETKPPVTTMTVPFNGSWVNNKGETVTPPDNAKITATVKNSDGSVAATVTLDKSNGWKAFQELPCSNGYDDFKYTVSYSATGDYVTGVGGTPSFSGANSSVNAVGLITEPEISDGKMAIQVVTNGIVATGQDQWQVQINQTVHRVNSDGSDNWDKNQYNFPEGVLNKSTTSSTISNMNVKDNENKTIRYKMHVQAEHITKGTISVIDPSGNTIIGPTNFTDGWNGDLVFDAKPGAFTVRIDGENATTAANTKSQKMNAVRRNAPSLKAAGDSNKTFTDDINHSGIILPSDADPVGEPVVLKKDADSAKNWKHLWENLPVADSEGNTYYYYVKEVSATTSDDVQELGAAYAYENYSDESGRIHKVTIENTPKIVDVEIKLHKKDESDDSELANVPFTLWKKAGDGTSGGEYAEVEGYIDVKTGSTGEITFSKLKPGDYMITEGTPLPGYLALAEEIKFTIGNDGKVTGFTDTVHVKLDGETLVFTITNEKGAALPSTGGPGTRIFTILGSILILGAGVLLWRRRRLI